ncbi:hypothetical protein V1478_018108, partial [Vespula squamosa]
CSGAIKSPTRDFGFCLKRRLFDHTGHADFKLVGPQMQQPPRGGTWVGSTCNISISKSKLNNASTTGRMAAYFKVFPIAFLSIFN